MKKNNTAVNLFEKWKNIKDIKITKILNKFNQEEINESFGAVLDFGTAGMRGVMGIGSAKINEVNVTKLAYVIGEYINQNYENKSIVVGYDTRNNSKEYAHIFAKVLSNKGIKVNIFDNFCPTPVLLFSIKKTGSCMGIMITASHNKKEYNGIKISGENAIQISGNIQKELSKLYSKNDEVEIYNQFYKINDNDKNIKYVGEKIINNFLSLGKIKKDKTHKNINIVYTPLNGTGYECVTKILAKAGFNVFCPKQQLGADGNFSTCPYPNPEFEEAFSVSKEYAKQVNADIIIATDPDADRIGVMYQKNGEYFKLSGNEVAYLFLENIIKKSAIVKNKVVVTSVVTSPLINTMCEYNKILSVRVLTGFKNLGKAKLDYEQEKGADSVLFTAEESCGYILKQDFYDKDGVFACYEMCKLASQLKQNNKNLGDFLNDIFIKYGYMANVSDNIVYSGNDSLVKMWEVVEKLRNKPLSQISGERVENIIDYNDSKKTKLEKQNFLEFRTKSITLIVRPSGTEPKLKFYIYAKDKTYEDATNKANNVIEEIKKVLS